MRKLPGAFVMGAVVALTAACSGSSSPANNAGGPASGSPGATPSAGASSPAASGSASPGSKATPTSAPASGHVVTSGPGSKPPGQPTGFTRAGTYTYDISGTVTTRLGAQKQSGTDTLAVDAPKNGQQKTTQSSKQGRRDTTLAARSGGLFLVDMTFHQPGFDEDFKPVGTGLYFPADYKVGRSWSWSAKSTDGNYTLAVTSKITSTDKVTVQGQSVPTLVVDSTLQITGSEFDLTDKQRDWVSTAYALVVKEHLSTKGKTAGFTYSSDETRTIRSIKPA